MLNKQDAKNQFKSMKPMSLIKIKNRVIELYSKSQIDVLLDVIYRKEEINE